MMEVDWKITAHPGHNNLWNEEGKVGVLDVKKRLGNGKSTLRKEEGKDAFEKRSGEL
jgi:hypothetical protein